MSILYDMARMSVTGTPGTGTITLNAAISGFQTFTAAGVPTGARVAYSIQDGSAWEIGRGTYTTSGTSLTRGVVFSSNSNALVSLTSGAQVWIAMLAEEASMAAGAVNVEQYGAVGDGTTNDTAAFNAALAANRIVMCGLHQKYAVNNITMNNGNVLMGMRAPMLYDDSSSVSTSAAGPILVAMAGAPSIININGISKFGLFDMILNGVTTAGPNGISAGGQFGDCRGLTIINCATGVVAPNVIKFTLCEFGYCNNGVTDPDDCQFVACDWSANNQSGLVVSNGYGASEVSCSRFEWNGQYGCDIQGNDIAISGCFWDSNGFSGIRLSGALNVSISGGTMRESATSNAANPGQRSHILINASDHILIGGIATRAVVTPQYFCEWTGTNTNIVRGNNVYQGFMTACDLGVSPDQTTQSITATGQTIAVGMFKTVVLTTTTGASMTGMILAAGTIGGQTFTIINTTAFTIVFAASGTSHVFGTPTQAANVAQDFVWDATNTLWRMKA